jgi:mRNA interferase RelE/StbE
MVRVVIDDLVLEKDFKKIDLADQKRILTTIRKKLATEPKKFGQPLRGELKKYWKLRVGEYRVIYEILEEQVLVYIILVGFRRDEDVYKAAVSRLIKMG